MLVVRRLVLLRKLPAELGRDHAERLDAFRAGAFRPTLCPFLAPRAALRVLCAASSTPARRQSAPVCCRLMLSPRPSSQRAHLPCCAAFCCDHALQMYNASEPGSLQKRPHLYINGVVSCNSCPSCFDPMGCVPRFASRADRSASLAIAACVCVRCVPCDADCLHGWTIAVRFSFPL